eukprot:Gb_24000 [translate_table: standard]
MCVLSETGAVEKLACEAFRVAEVGKPSLLDVADTSEEERNLEDPIPSGGKISPLKGPATAPAEKEESPGGPLLCSRRSSRLQRKSVGKPSLLDVADTSEEERNLEDPIPSGGKISPLKGLCDPWVKNTLVKKSEGALEGIFVIVICKNICGKIAFVEESRLRRLWEENYPTFEAEQVPFVVVAVARSA